MTIRAPLLTRIERPRPPTHDRPNNLLLTTLGIAAAAPFAQRDWPVPRGAIGSIELRTCVDGSEFWLLKDQFFGAAGQPPPNRDFPNPRGAIPAIELRTYIDGSEFWLLRDQFFGVAGQPPANFDQAVPRGPQPAIALRAHWNNLLESTLVPATGTPPFVQSNWPVPTGPRASIDLRTHVDASEFWLLKDQFYGVAGQPPANLDWPNPRGREYAIALRFTANDLLQSTLAPALAQQPFAQSDWPVPSGPRTNIELRSYIDPSETWLLKDQFFGVAGQPPSPSDFPNPRGRDHAIALRFTANDLLQSTLAPNLAIPFAQTEWPVPRGAIPGVELRTYVDASEFWLLKDKFYGAAGQPPANFDWPVPKSARAARQEASLSTSVVFFSVSIVVVPISGQVGSVNGPATDTVNGSDSDTVNGPDDDTVFG